MHAKISNSLVGICGAVAGLTCTACGDETQPGIMAGSSQDLPEHPGVYLNELDADNDGDDRDEYEILDLQEDPADWIELYNANDVAISILGWSLTDNRRPAPVEQRLLDYEIPPGGVLLIRNLDSVPPPSYGSPYALIGMRQAGDEVGLYDEEGTLVDCIRWEGTFGGNGTYVLARFPNGGQWRQCNRRTPGVSNGVECAGDSASLGPIHEQCTTVTFAPEPEEEADAGVADAAAE